LKALFILDACVLIAALTNEDGADNARKIIQVAIDGNAAVKIT
jgi:hypothetical protein